MYKIWFLLNNPLSCPVKSVVAEERICLVGPMLSNVLTLRYGRIRAIGAHAANKKERGLF